MSSPFKVIIVGGGPVGLITAHILSAVNIDYVLLERHHTFETGNGATVVIWPHNVRILDQLGLVNGFRDVCIELHEKVNLRPDGSVISQSDMPDAAERLHGHGTMICHRFRLVKFLYESLADKTKILTSQEVERVEVEENSVTVHCKGGRTHAGSLVIGADGVNSKVRELMLGLASAQGQDLAGGAPFSSIFRTLFGYTKSPLPGAKPGIVYETRGKDVHFQVTVIKAQANFAAYFSLPEPTTDSPKFTAAEQEEHAARIADRVIHPNGTKFKDLWMDRKWSHLSNVEEGLGRHWHWHRIVLLGDSVTKQAPEAALGLNTGVQNTVALVNSLVQLLQDQSQPSLAAIEQALTAFQHERKSPSAEACRTAALTARMSGWQSAPLRLADLYLLPHLGGDLTLLRWILAPLIRSGVVLDSLNEKHRRDGTVKWKRHPRIEATRVG